MDLLAIGNKSVVIDYYKLLHRMYASARSPIIT